MKTMTLLAALTLSLLATGAAHAGATSFSDVKVTATSASGSIGDARKSADASQLIGCSIKATSTTVPKVTCVARTAAGVSASCSSTNSYLVAAAQAVNGDSYIYFSWTTDGVNYCNSIIVDNASYLEPKE